MLLYDAYEETELMLIPLLELTWLGREESLEIAGQEGRSAPLGKDCGSLEVYEENKVEEMTVVLTYVCL